MRTLDIGGVKALPCPNRENNPFLGWRGIRLPLIATSLLSNCVRLYVRVVM
ncbi:hypothetical protein O9992_12220 [Vibrio lentus]|nr:hypothetical protein [Vibrio lentus]